MSILRLYSINVKLLSHRLFNSYEEYIQRESSKEDGPYLRGSMNTLKTREQQL